MVSKVFLFEGGGWLHCRNVSLKDGTWYGFVVNGNWRMKYDGVSIDSGQGKLETKLIWMCDPTCHEYNAAIVDAEERYNAGEPANYEIVEKQIDTSEDEVAF